MDRRCPRHDVGFDRPIGPTPAARELRRADAVSRLEREGRTKSPRRFREDAPWRTGTHASRRVAELRAQSHRRVQRGLRAGQSRPTGHRGPGRVPTQCALSIAALRALDDAGWEKVGWSPEGERPYHRFQETRVVDSWIHLQDIRDALLQPEDDHGPGEEIVVNRFESALPYIVGKRMKSPDGTLVQVNLSGRLARSV